jgi:hypothetical protein
MGWDTFPPYVAYPVKVPQVACKMAETTIRTP